MNFVLVIILVANGRSYSETPLYVIPQASQQTCEAEAAKYPTSGTKYKTAVCVPSLVKAPPVVN